MWIVELSLEVLLNREVLKDRSISWGIILQQVYYIMVIKVIYGIENLKIVPKKKVDLTKFFDSADLGMNIEDWGNFERRFYEL